MEAEPTLAAILGPWLIGAVVAATLWGLTIHQAGNYARMYRKTDRTSFVVLVSVMFLICTVDWAVTLRTTWWLFVERGLGSAPGQLALVFMPVLAATCGHLFYGYRLWRLCAKPLWLAPPLALLVIAPLGVGSTAIAFDVIVHADSPEDPDLMRHYHLEINTLQAWTWVSAGVDVVLCVGISCRLLLARSTDDVKDRTSSLLGSLVRLSCTTAALTAVIAGGNAIALATSGAQTNSAIAFFLCQPYTYALSVMYTLVSRRQLRLPAPATVTATERSVHTVPTILRHALGNFRAPSPQPSPVDLRDPHDSKAQLRHARSADAMSFSSPSVV